MLLSVVIPAFKQEKTIKEDVERILDVMYKTRFDFEIIIVVDGRVDNTLQYVKEIKSEKVFVYDYEENRGKGFAVKYGMAKSKGDLVAFIDSGMEIDPNGISMLLEHMLWYKADIIVGSKRHPASNVEYPKSRKIFSNMYFLLVKILFRLNVRDTQVGLKIFRRKVLEQVLPRLVIKRYAFDIELLAVAKYLGFSRIYEAPVSLKMDLGAVSILNGKFYDFAKAFLIDTLAVFYRMYFLRYYSDKNKGQWEQNNPIKLSNV